MGNIQSSTDIDNYISSPKIQTDIEKHSNKKLLGVFDFLQNNNNQDYSIINKPIIQGFTILQYAIITSPK